MIHIQIELTIPLGNMWCAAYKYIVCKYAYHSFDIWIKYLNWGYRYQLCIMEFLNISIFCALLCEKKVRKKSIISILFFFDT